MFSYAAISKLMVFDSFRIQLLIQPIPKWSVEILSYLLPALELIISFLLIFRRSRGLGLLASASMMLLFSVYVGLAMTGAFGSIPCTCGGIIQKLSWPQHFIFNLLFLLISIYGIILDLKERRFIGK